MLDCEGPLRDRHVIAEVKQTGGHDFSRATPYTHGSRGVSRCDPFKVELCSLLALSDSSAVGTKTPAKFPKVSAQSTMPMACYRSCLSLKQASRTSRASRI